MIVLDEQLMGRSIEDAIRRWYPGMVCFVGDLRPGSVIKDDSIPLLLSREDNPTFVTINVSDFWRRVSINETFCVVCVAFPDSRVAEIPSILRRFFRHREFHSKAARAGVVARLTSDTASHYTVTDPTVRTLDGW